MEFIVWVDTQLVDRNPGLQQVAKLERPSSGAQPEEIGLTLQDSKTVPRCGARRQTQQRGRSRIENPSPVYDDIKCTLYHPVGNRSVTRGIGSACLYSKDYIACI